MNKKYIKINLITRTKRKIWLTSTTFVVKLIIPIRHKIKSKVSYNIIYNTLNLILRRDLYIHIINIDTKCIKFDL